MPDAHEHTAELEEGKWWHHDFPGVAKRYDRCMDCDVPYVCALVGPGALATLLRHQGASPERPG